jgi:hypothetical protein
MRSARNSLFDDGFRPFARRKFPALRKLKSNPQMFAMDCGRTIVRTRENLPVGREFSAGDGAWSSRSSAGIRCDFPITSVLPLSQTR